MLPCPYVNRENGHETLLQHATSCVLYVNSLMTIPLTHRSMPYKNVQSLWYVLYTQCIQYHAPPWLQILSKNSPMFCIHNAFHSMPPWLQTCTNTRLCFVYTQYALLLSCCICGFFLISYRSQLYLSVSINWNKECMHIVPVHRYNPVNTKTICICVHVDKRNSQKCS